jgi:pimeloyl-ACP methyl ester carboxylesterase
MSKHSSLALSISSIALLFALIGLTTNRASAQIWTVLAGDPKGDAADATLADAAQLAYRYEKERDLLWFRVTVYGAPDEQTFGVNIVVDTGSDDAAKVNWWGANKAFRFDKLVTAWVTRGSDGYQGTIGVADATGIKAKQFHNLFQNDLQIKIEGDSIIIGIKRTDITDKLKMNLIAAVGSNEHWNDDLPNIGSATLDLAAERPKRGLREIDLSRNNLKFPAKYQTLPNEKAPLVKKLGRGKQAVILIPGMYSGNESFAGFISQNQSRYQLYVLTPPGINGTPPRPMPAQGPRLGELFWTRLLERDILDLIRRERMRKPVIVAERQPGSVAAVELALQHPEELGGIILTGSNLLPFTPSPKDPTRRTPARLAERVAGIEEGLAAKWFKYVTPETWDSNDYRPEWFSSDASRGQKAWNEIEAAPLEVKIRYICEFWSSNVTDEFNQLQVPVLVLVPGFDETFLADPVNNLPKTSFMEAWNTVAPKPKLELVKIAGARLLVLENQSKPADEAIAGFMERVYGAK